MFAGRLAIIVGFFLFAAGQVGERWKRFMSLPIFEDSDVQTEGRSLEKPIEWDAPSLEGSVDLVGAAPSIQQMLLSTLSAGVPTLVSSLFREGRVIADNLFSQKSETVQGPATPPSVVVTIYNSAPGAETTVETRKLARIH